MDIKWEHLFTKKILQRGWQYFRDGAVISQAGKQTGNTYISYVRGSESYRVKIQLNESSVASMQCSCPYAHDGYRCKHMAAVLYDMEADGKLKYDGEKYSTSGCRKVSRPVPVRVFPFRSTEGGRKPYRFYNFEKLTAGYEFYDQQLASAQKLIEEGKLVLREIHEGFLRTMYLSSERQCRVMGDYVDRNGVTRTVTILFSREQIHHLDCSSPECRNTSSRYTYYQNRRQEMCVHQLALLLLAKDYIEKKRIGDATDYQAMQLLAECRAKRAANRVMETAAEHEKQNIHLEPRLTVESDGSMYVDFRVGKEKLYVIKNLTHFVDTVESKGEMKLGTKNSISFAAGSLDEESQPLYRFIKSEVLTSNMRNDDSRHWYHSEVEGSIPLYGRTLDGFYQLMEGKTIPYVCYSSGKKTTGRAECGQNSPKGQLRLDTVMDDDGNFDGAVVRGELPDLVDGVDFKYFFNGEKLNRASADKLELLDVLQPESYRRDIQFTIGRQKLSEFYYRVLPALKEFAEIKTVNSEELEKYLYPEGTYTFYLDAEDGILTCEPKVQYGEASCSLAGTVKGTPSADAAYEEFRDLLMEEVILQKVKEYFPYEEEDGRIHCGEEEDLQYKVLTSGVDALLRLGDVHATDRFKRITIRRKPQMTEGVRMESDLLNLNLTSSELSEEELLEILRSYRRKKKYHRLKNGDFVQLEEETMEELQQLMKLGNASPEDFVKGDMQVPAYRALYLDKVLEKKDVLYAKRDSTFRTLVKEFKTVSDSEYEVPGTLQNVVRSYQEFGYKWLRTVESYRFGGILADDMGLGKTLQMISVLLAAKQENRLGTALVVTPASLVYNWKEEFAKFAPQLAVEIMAGSKSEREEIMCRSESADVLITSYDLLKRDILFYKERSFSYQIIDEAQYIKTHTTAAAKAVKAVNSKIRFALTGTPIENRLSELWSIFDFLMPGFLYTYDRFRSELEQPIVKQGDERTMKRLKRMVEPFILRRLKQDVLSDLPEKNEEVCYVNFEEKQQQLYDGQVLHMKQILEEESEESFRKNRFAILAEITKIRQICCDPALCLDNYDGPSAKRETCLELIKSAVDGGHKILIFSQFRALLELVEKDLRQEGIVNFKITGETKKEDRVELVNRFNQDGTPVFLISLKAGGTGLNLTGADIVIHLDPWWNVAAQNQATDRAHRIGQTKNVSVYKLIAKNSIEEKILRLQESKAALADEILDGNTGGLMSMSREDLLELL